MGVAGSAVFVTPNEYGVVIFLRPIPGLLTAFVDHSAFCKGVEDISVNESLLEQIGVELPHSWTGRREDKFLWFLRLRRYCLGISDPLAVQQTFHRLWVSQAVIRLDKGNRVASLLRFMIVPLVAPHSDAVV